MMEGPNYLGPKTVKPWYKHWWGVALLVLFFLILVLAIFIGYNFYKTYQQMKTAAVLTPEAIASQADIKIDNIIDEYIPRLGSADAPIKIVEFGDFNCEFSLAAMPIIKQILNKYPDKIVLYWRNYPVVAENSPDLAKGGICANEQGKFWAYHDRLFQLKKLGISFSVAEVVDELSLDKEKFNNCLLGQLTESFLRTDYYASQTASVTGTPTFVLNGFRLPGVVPFSQWVKLIDALLPIYEK